MALTAVQKRNRADQLFDNAYTFLSQYFQTYGFTTIPAQKINIPKFEEVDVYMRVTGTNTDAELDIIIEHDGIYYARRDNVVNGIRNSGTWNVIPTPTIEDIIQGPPYSIQVATNTYVTF
jgi:hypothetical protein